MSEWGVGWGGIDAGIKLEAPLCSPVSYDTWVSASEVDGDVEDPPSTDRPWKVSSTNRRPVLAALHTSLWMI